MTFYAVRNEKHNIEYIRYTKDFDRVYKEFSILKQINPAMVKHPFNTYGGIQDWDMVFIKEETVDKYRLPIIREELKQQRKSISVFEYTESLKKNERINEHRKGKDRLKQQRQESRELRMVLLNSLKI
jgi:hypothetical protein